MTKVKYIGSSKGRIIFLEYTLTQVAEYLNERQMQKLTKDGKIVIKNKDKTEEWKIKKQEKSYFFIFKKLQLAGDPRRKIIPQAQSSCQVGK